MQRASCDMEWSNKRTLAFIVDYRNSPELWNKTSNDYKNTAVRNTKLINLANKYKCSVREVKVKIKNLRSAYHRERKKVKARSNSASIYPKRKWFAYEPLRFLSDFTESAQTSLAFDTDDEEFEFPVDEPDYNQDTQHSLPELKEPSEKLLITTNNCKSDVEENSPAINSFTTRQNCLASSMQEDRANYTIKKPYEEEYSIFGKYVASELRNLGPRVQTIVKHLINNILFDAAMGKYVNYDTKKNNNGTVPPENYENASEHVITLCHAEL